MMNNIEKLSKSFTDLTKTSEEQFASIKDQIKEQYDKQLAVIQEQIKNQFTEHFTIMITALSKSPTAASNGEGSIEENHPSQSLWSSSSPSSSAESFSNGLIENSLDRVIENEELHGLKDDAKSSLEGASTTGILSAQIGSENEALKVFDKLPKPAKKTTVAYKLFVDDVNVPSRMDFHAGATFDQVLGNLEDKDLNNSTITQFLEKQKDIKVACHDEMPRMFFVKTMDELDGNVDFIPPIYCVPQVFDPGVSIIFKDIRAAVIATTSLLTKLFLPRIIATTCLNSNSGKCHSFATFLGKSLLFCVPRVFDPGISTIHGNLGATVMLNMPWQRFCIYNKLIQPSVIITTSLKSSTGSFCSISTIEKVGMYSLNSGVQLMDTSRELFLSKVGLKSCEYSAVCLPNDWSHEASVIKSLELDVYFCIDVLLMIIFDPGGGLLESSNGCDPFAPNISCHFSKLNGNHNHDDCWFDKLNVQLICIRAKLVIDVTLPVLHIILGLIVEGNGSHISRKVQTGRVEEEVYQAFDKWIKTNLVELIDDMESQSLTLTMACLKRVDIKKVLFLFDPGGCEEFDWFWIEGVVYRMYFHSRECLVRCLWSQIISLVDEMKKADMENEGNCKPFGMINGVIGSPWLDNGCDAFNKHGIAFKFSNDRQLHGPFTAIKEGSVLEFFRIAKVILIVLFVVCFGKDSGLVVEVMMVYFGRFIWDAMLVLVHTWQDLLAAVHVVKVAKTLNESTMEIQLLSPIMGWLKVEL